MVELLWLALVAAILVTGVSVYRLLVELRPSNYDPAASKRLWNMLLLRAPKPPRLMHRRGEDEEATEREM